MSFITHLPAWLQWTIAIVMLASFIGGVCFTLFVTWPFIRASMRSIEQGTVVNARLVRILERLERAGEHLSVEEVKEVLVAIKAMSKSGGKDLASRI